MSSSYPVKKVDLHTPPLKDVAEFLQEALKENFSEASCEVVECPDLTESPWDLAAPGLCGSPRIGEAGGVRFLCPFPKKDKTYDLSSFGEQIGLSSGLIIGAGAGPLPYAKVNSEYIPNLRFGSSPLNKSRIAKIVPENGSCVLSDLPQDETRCSILLNFFACEGKPGSVLKVKAANRTGADDFVGCMRKALLRAYNAPTGLGGTFRMTKGTALIHVMPDFTWFPLFAEWVVNRWLRWFHMAAPMNFMSVMMSKETPEFGFRLEHTHGYSAEGKGGHYHYDTTPDNVQYEGYFNLAHAVYRIDEP